MKLLLSLSFSIFFTFSFSSVAVESIFVDGSNVSLDLSGYHGRDGHRGKNCKAGEDGKDGQSGSDIVIYYSQINHLKNVELNMTGGRGGLAGRKGSRINCDGKVDRTRAKDGVDGSLGYISLVKGDTLLAKHKNTSEIILSSSHDQILKFSSHSWKSEVGSKDLFHSHSQIRNEYVVFDKTIYTDIKLELSTKVQEMDLGDITLKVRYNVKYTSVPRLSLYRDNKKLKVLIDFDLISKNGLKTISIKNLYFKDEISNTSFVGSNNSGLATTISLKDPLFLDSTFKNRFHFNVYRYHPFIERYVIVGGASSNYLNTTQESDILTINIGSASVFSNEFLPGSKYKVEISTYKSIGANSLGYSFESTFTISK